MTLAIRLGIAGAAFGAIGLGIVGMYAPIAAREAAFAYLFGFATVFNCVVGVLFLLLIGNATNATWFVPIRRLCEQVVAGLPALAVAFVPILFAERALYSWDNPTLLTQFERPRVDAKAAWLAPAFFTVRSVAYLVVIVLVSELLRRWSITQDEARDPEVSRRLRRRIVALSVGGLVVVGLVFTFASFDWFMSLEPAWYSDMYGVYTFAGALFAGLGLIGALTVLARRRRLLPTEVGDEHYHALGRLQLTMVIFWAYIAWAHVLQHWIANEPAEQLWHIRRWGGGWGWCGVALIIVHFVLPFFVLLFRNLKRTPHAFFFVSLWLLAAHVLDVFYLIWPAYARRFEWPPVALAAIAGVGGAALALAALRGSRSSSVAAGDPLFARGLRYESWS